MEQTPPLEGVDKALMAFSAIAIVAVMLIVTADVLLRYLFTRPLIWAYDVIGLYMMAVVFFLALPQSLRHHSHICVDILVHAIPPRLRHALEALGYAATTALLAALVWLTADRLLTGFINDEVVDGAVSLPAWIAQVPVLAGSAMLALHCLLRCLKHGGSVFAARPLIDFPPQSGMERVEQ